MRTDNVNVIILDSLARLRTVFRRLVPLTMIWVGPVLYSGGCTSYDSFQNTVPTFRLDMHDYAVGDTIRLTFTLQGESSVRYYENIENTLDVWLAFRTSYEGDQTVATFDGIQSDEIKPRGRGAIVSSKLEKDKPLILTFKGSLQETAGGDAFLLVFPGLNRRFVVQKADFARALSLEIHGHLRPIDHSPFDALEDYVEPVTLSIPFHQDEINDR